MNVTVNRANVNYPDGERVTIFFRIRKTWHAICERRVNVEYPSFKADEEFWCKWTAGRRTLKALTTALTHSKVDRQTLIAAGGNYGGKSKLKIAEQIPTDYQT